MERALIALGVIIVVCFVFFIDMERLLVFECPVCRARRQQLLWLKLPLSDKIITNSFSAWYSAAEPNHSHRWFPRSSTAYRALGSIKISGQLRPLKIFSIDPNDERRFLEKNFTRTQIKLIANNLQSPSAENIFYWALYGDETNAQHNLDELRLWVGQNQRDPGH